MLSRKRPSNADRVDTPSCDRLVTSGRMRQVWAVTDWCGEDARKERIRNRRFLLKNASYNDQNQVDDKKETADDVAFCKFLMINFFFTLIST